MPTHADNALKRDTKLGPEWQLALRFLHGSSPQELRTTMHELGDLLEEQEIAQFMSVMDVNNDGVIGVSAPSPAQPSRLWRAAPPLPKRSMHAAGRMHAAMRGACQALQPAA